MRRIIAAATLLALASGCVEVEERIALERDGSGTLSLSLGIDRTLLRIARTGGQAVPEAGALRAAFAGHEGVEVTDARTWTADGTRWERVDVRFEHVDRLRSIGTGSRYDLGEVHLGEDERGNLVYQRTVRLAAQPPAEAEGATEGFARQALRPVLGRYPWRFRVRFASPVVEANTPARRIDPETHSVRWEYSLADLVGEARTMRAVVRPPARPLLAIAAGVTLMLALSALAWLALRRRRRRV